MGLLSVDRVQLEVVIGNDKARKNMRELEDETKKINRELRKLKEGSDEWIQKMDELKKVQTKYDEVRKKIGMTGLSMKDLRRRQRELNAAMNELDPNLPEYKKLQKELQEVNTRMRDLRSGSRAAQSSLSRLADKFNKYQTLGASFLATVTGIVFSLKEWVAGNVGLDDSLANVMKTTQLTRKEARELYSDFKYLNTRTPRNELLLLAEEAGRLGKRGKKDIMDFVEVGNKIKTALGDDLGDNAEESIREVGKLVSIYQVGSKHGVDFGFSMEMVGSAINAVSANSQAQAPFMIDLLKRMGGVADQADLSADQVIGLASTLDNLGQTAEVSGTAMSKMVVNMFTDTADYAAIAKMDVADFSKLLKEDSNAALIKFLEGLNGNNEGLSVMAGKLDALGIDGGRAVGVLSTLAGNTQMLREQQALANREMLKATSLTDEYNIKNNNMAGNLAIIGSRIRSIFVNSTINKGLENFIGFFAKYAKISMVEKLEKEKVSANHLVIEMTNMNTTAERRNEIYNELKSLSPEIVEGIDLENISVEKLVGNMQRYNETMVKRIVLQERADELSKKEDLATRFGVKRQEAEIALYDEMIAVKDRVAKSDKAVAEQMYQAILSGDDYLDIWQQLSFIYSDHDHNLKNMGNSMGEMYQAMRTLEDARAVEKKYVDDLNSSYAEYDKLQERMLGKSKELKNSKQQDSQQDKSDIASPKTPETLQAEYQQALSALDSYHQEAILSHLEMLSQKRISEEEHKELMLLSEMDYLAKKMQLQEEAGESTTATEIQLQNKILAYQAYHAARAEQMEQLYLEYEASLDKEWEDFVDLEEKKIAKKFKDEEAITQKERSEQAKRLRHAGAFAQDIGSLIGESIADTEKGIEEFGKQLLLLALEILRKQVYISTGMAWAVSLGQPDSILTLGATGTTRALLTIALIESAYAAVKGAISGFYVGGYTGDGSPYEVAGNVHKGEYVVNHQMMQNPWVANQVGIMEAMRTGQATSSTVTNNTTNNQVVQTDPMLISVLAELNEKLKKPIRASMPYTEWKEMHDEVTEIENSVTRE